MSRYCLEYADSDLFLLNDFFKQFPLPITEYHWVIGDILNMMDLSEDKDHWNDIIGEREDYLFITGEEFHRILNEFEIYVIFSILTAVPKETIPYDLTQVPFVDGNADFYEDDYISPVKECVFEVGFFDSTDIIFTVTDKNIERLMKDAFPDLKPYCEYRV
ncbi:hypothetical protein LJ568_08865 [Bacillus halotolerans]|uniref:hypothetical protein n=1 Tax=Bacillus halotolerans TaxID=260554 RepID=UPI001D0D8FCB|nr:hypothetical protein [Bacillus halotolerans]MCC2115782.1 hypothetical protein [Bacillus halotolerans]MDL5610112.1 hypothetical protein [Bacillus halotolerans]